MSKSSEPKGKGNVNLSYECNSFSLKHNGQTPGSKGVPSVNEFSLSKSGKKPA